jgi:hypothetical protein
LESCLGRKRGVNVELGKILKLNRDLVARSMVSKAPQKDKLDSLSPDRAGH